MADKVNIETEKVGGGFWTNPATKATATDAQGDTVAEQYAPGHSEDAASTARANVENELASQRQSKDSENDQTKE